MSAWEIRAGHVLDVLRGMPDESVQCAVTSPPYWGLRDYGVPATVWGGAAGCAHVWGAMERGRRKDLLPEAETASMGLLAKDDRQGRAAALNGGHFCSRCNAWLGCLGLEPNPSLYVAHLVEVFAEVRRVLRRDGTLWLNLGDSMATRPRGSDNGWDKSRLNNPGRIQKAQHAALRSHRSFDGLSAKNAILLPARVAIAMQDDGWHLRTEIVWAKGNPMPESIQDRPTKSHEYVFLFSRNSRRPLWWRARDTREWSQSPDRSETVAIDGKIKRRWRGFDYIYDADAVREPYAYGGEPNGAVHSPHGQGFARRAAPYRSGNGFHRPERLSIQGAGQEEHWEADERGRNLRSVWSINTTPFPEAHFAVFPKELPRRCILAGSRPGDVILDPFTGAGTTGLVALELDRQFVGIEFSPVYLEMANRRIHNEAGLLSVEGAS